MAKSKRKSGSSTEVSRWENELAQAQMNEDGWKAMVVFAVPNQLDDILHCSIMSDVIATGLRKLFTVVDYDALLKEVKDLAHGKAGKVKVSKPPQFVEIVDSIKMLMDQGDAVAPATLAKLLKFKLLMIKQKDHEKREEERKAAEAAAKQTKNEERSRSKGASAAGKRTKSASPGKKKGKKDDAPPSPKKDTKLKRRGELEDTFKTIDDEPDEPDDPNHYIIITSVYDPHVIQPLIDLGVPIDAIIKLKSESYDVKPKEKPIDPDENEEDVKEGTEQNEAELEEERKRNEEIKQKLAKFWKDSDVVIREAPSGLPIKDIANLSVVIKDSIVPVGDLKELEPDTKTEYGTKLFDCTANVCFELLNAKKRYRRYIDSLKLTNIPLLHTSNTTATPIPQTGSVVSARAEASQGQAEKQDADMRYYNHLMDQVPSESYSPALILDVLLRQVEATVDHNDPMDLPIPARQDLLERSLGSHLDFKLENLGLKNPDTQNKEETKTTPSKPVIIHHGDDRIERTYHLEKVPEIDVHSAEEDIFKRHPFSSLFEGLCLPEVDQTSINTRKQQLAHFCAVQDDQLEFEKKLALMSFELLPIKHVAADGEVSDPFDDDRDIHIGWDDPYMSLKGSSEVMATSDESYTKHIEDLKILRNLTEYKYSEYFDAKTIPQVLERASEIRPYVDMYYHQGLCSLLLVFHNPKDDLMRNKKSWDEWLHSNVGFRNYLEYVAESVKEWQKEKDIEDEIRKRPVTPPPQREPTPPPLKEPNRNHLLTRAEMQEMKAEEESKQKKKGGKSRSPTKTPGKRPGSERKSESAQKKDKAGSAKKRLPSAKRTASRTGTARRNLKSSQDKTIDDEEANKDKIDEEGEKEYPYHGYDVGDELIHVSGEISYLFPQNGSSIKIEKSSYINGNISVRAVVCKDENYVVLDLKNPIPEVDQSNDRSGTQIDMEATQSGSKDQVVENADTEGEGEEKEEHEVMKMASEIPAIPEVKSPCNETSCLTVNFQDGMLVGIASVTSKSLRDDLEKVTSLVEDAKSCAEKLSLGVIPGATTGKGGSPKGKRKHEDELKRLEELEKQLDRETRSKIQTAIRDVSDIRKMCLGRSNLSINCPDGLQVTFIHSEIKEEEFSRQLFLKQEYISSAGGVHPCEKLRMKPAMEELSRYVTVDGTVIKYMKDGSLVVLFADGGVCSASNYNQKASLSNLAEGHISNNNETANLAANESVNQARKPTAVISQNPVIESQVTIADTPDVEWQLTNTMGERYQRKSSENTVKLEEILVSHATCPKTSQVLETREDGVVTVKRPDGTIIVEHTDGTRITTFYVNESSKTDGETGEQSTSQHGPVKHYKVECIGYATILTNKRDHSFTAVFGNGSEIVASLAGEYKVTKPDLTHLYISNGGDVLFAPKGSIVHEPDEIPALFQHVEENGPPTGVYLLKTSSRKCLSMVDQMGNKFDIECNGDAFTERNDASTDNELDPLPPRYFIIHKDGSGEELLQYADIKEHLEKAEKNPCTAVLKSDTEGTKAVSGITILQPFPGSSGAVWLKQKDEKEIIPAELRERDFKTLPSREIKTTGPQFGIHAGVAFNVATKPAPKQPKPVPTCPEVLQMRHLTQFSGLSTEERRKMIHGIETYRKIIDEQTVREQGLLPKDPRNDEEKRIAEELLQKLKEIEPSEGLFKDDPRPIEDSMADGYVDGTKIPDSPPPEKAKPKRPAKEWEEDMVELAELKYAKDSLRTGNVPPYFDTDKGQQFLYGQTSLSELDQLAADLAKETVHPSYRPASETSTASIGITPEISKFSNPSREVYDLQSKDEIFDLQKQSLEIVDTVDSKQSLGRPGNPTPAEATTNGDSGLGIHRDAQSRTRPYNPTPLHALKTSSVMLSNSAHESVNGMPAVAEDPTQYEGEAATQYGMAGDDTVSPVGYPYHSTAPADDNNGIHGNIDTGSSPRSIEVDVNGEPRKTAVKIPSSLRGSRPGALPNAKFISIEEPVRRQVKTSSVAGTVQPDLTSKLRGFELVPDFVDFGVLKEGHAYSCTVMLKNVGIDSCRYKITQPPPSTGLKVIYQPGPVAAGMSARLDVEIFAVAVGVEGTSGVGSIGHHIEFISETDAFYLPVSATILTAHEYDNRSDSSPRGGPSSKVLLISNRPSSREAITRPRKF